MDLLKKLLYFFDRGDRLRGLGLAVLILIGALIETVGIGLIMPYMALITDRSMTSRYRLLSWAYSLGHFKSHESFIFWTGVGFFGVYVFKNLFMGALTFLQARFVADGEVKISRRLLTTYVQMPYVFHLQRNSAELLQNTRAVGQVFSHVLMPLLIIATEMTVLAAVVFLLLALDPIPTLLAVGSFGSISYVMYRLIRNRTRKIGEQQHRCGIRELQAINQALGGVKETKILGTQKYFVDSYVESLSKSAHLLKTAQFLGQIPKLVIETFVIGAIIAIVCIHLWRGKDPALILPTLAVFALSAIRLMPSMNRIMSNILVIRQSKTALDIVYFDARSLERDPKPAEISGQASTPLPFRGQIELKNIWFRYPNVEAWALRDISLTIARGSSVALIGPSGAGKTTLVDVILGLLDPTQGQILVDGVPATGPDLERWQRNLGYIPQQIFLSDASIRENVAFGIPPEEIDDKKVWEALRGAQLEDFLLSMKYTLDTEVGERGIRLSGGQRQRIGIARALYHDPEVLVLDEATSALDSDTEREVSQAIDKLGQKKTILLIAHRLTTARNCKHVYKIVDGRIAEKGSYAEVCGASVSAMARDHY